MMHKDKLELKNRLKVARAEKKLNQMMASMRQQEAKK